LVAFEKSIYPEYGEVAYYGKNTNHQKGEKACPQ
jgi:hypothetical protein